MISIIESDRIPSTSPLLQSPALESLTPPPNAQRPPWYRNTASLESISAPPCGQSCRSLSPPPNAQRPLRYPLSPLPNAQRPPWRRNTASLKSISAPPCGQPHRSSTPWTTVPARVQEEVEILQHLWRPRWRDTDSDKEDEIEITKVNVRAPPPPRLVQPVVNNSKKQQRRLENQRLRAERRVLAQERLRKQQAVTSVPTSNAQASAPASGERSRKCRKVEDVHSRSSAAFNKKPSCPDRTAPASSSHVPVSSSFRHASPNEHPAELYPSPEPYPDPRF